MSVRRQCALLGLTRSNVYYRPAETPADDLRVMRQIDELDTARPFYGSRRMAAELARRGEAVNRKRVQRLLRLILPKIRQGPGPNRADCVPASRPSSRSTIP